MHTSLNGISEFSKLLLIGLGKRVKGQGRKGFAIVLFTVACILGSAFPLPLISSSGSSTAIAQIQDDRKAEAERLLQQGVQQYQTNQLNDALESFRQALEIYREIGDRTGEGNTLATLGQFNWLLNGYPDALVPFQQALTIFREIGDRTKESAILHLIGASYYFIKEYTQALESLQQALIIFRELGAQVEAGNTLAAIGEVYMHQEQYAQALEYYQQALTILRKTDNRVEEETILRTIRKLEALDSYQQALVISRKTGDRLREGSALNNIGEAYGELGKHEQALETFQQALTIFREIGEQAGEGATLEKIGEVYKSLEQYEQALEYLQQALAIHRATGDRAREKDTLFTIKMLGASLASQGGDQFHLGEFQAALELFQKELRISQDIGDQELKGSALTHIGGVYKNLGQYAQALESYQQSLTISRGIGDRLGEGVTLNNMAEVYISLGQYERALEYYQQALAINRATGERFEQGSTQAEEGIRNYLIQSSERAGQSTEQKLLNNIGVAYSRLGRYEQALEYLQQALAIHRKLGIFGNENTQATTLNNIGTAYLGLGLYEQALESFQEALTIQRARRNRPAEGTTLNNIGVAYLGLGQYEQSLESYQQALTIFKEVGARASESTSLSSIGTALFESNQLARAEAMLYEAITTLEPLRSSELSDEDRVSLFDTQVNVYKVLQQVLIAQNKTKPALEVAERGRARILAEVLATRLSERQVEEIVVRSPDLATIQRIAQQQNATLVQYSVIDNISVGAPSLYIWVIQPTGEFHFQAVDLSTLDRPLSDLVITSREAIGVRNRSELATIVPELKPEAQQRQQAQQRQKLQQLHQLLIEPIAQYLPSNPDERVIFIPQGELFLVPFPALVDTQGKYLIEKHTIVTAPSIQVLDLTRQQRQSIGANRRSPIRGDDLLVVGNPIMPKVWNPTKGIKEQLSSLPGAEEEAVTIAKAFATKPLLWEQASESAVVQRMPQARIIHLSTHGLLEYGNPQDSGARDVPGAIALSPSSKDDGLLTSAEILKMKLKAELVVLSACDTGRGRITGDGVIGLSRSLITAGVPSVIVSLWSVPDAPTASLMSEFYRQWQQNPDKAKALRQAMLITMQNHPNPRDWAAFTLIGESE